VLRVGALKSELQSLLEKKREDEKNQELMNPQDQDPLLICVVY
jgi:hypothetical protein